MDFILIYSEGYEINHIEWAFDYDKLWYCFRDNYLLIVHMSTIKNIYKQSWIILQKKNNSCGACAVWNAHMLKTWKKLSEEKLLEYVKTLPFPVWCENENVVEGIKSFWYSIIAEKSWWSLEEIEKYVKKWNLVIVNYYNPFQNVGHYAVIEDYDEMYFYMYDSIFWIYRLNKEAFEKVWRNFSGTIERWFVTIK